MELAAPATALSPAVKQLICCVGRHSEVVEDEHNQGHPRENETSDSDWVYVTSNGQLRLDHVASLLPGNTPYRHNYIGHGDTYATQENGETAADVRYENDRPGKGLFSLQATQLA